MEADDWRNSSFLGRNSDEGGESGCRMAAEAAKSSGNGKAGGAEGADVDEDCSDSSCGKRDKHVECAAGTSVQTRGRKEMRKGPWSAWEDQLLLDYVSKHGKGNWKEVAQRSGLRRCGKSCRLRWTNQLRPNLRKDRFTPAEEATILLLHSIHGNKWAKISAQVPGRTDNSIKNFMNTRAKRQRRQTAAAPSLHQRISAAEDPACHPGTSKFSLLHDLEGVSSSSSVMSFRLNATGIAHQALLQERAGAIHGMDSAHLTPCPVTYLSRSRPSVSALNLIQSREAIRSTAHSPLASLSSSEVDERKNKTIVSSGFAPISLTQAERARSLHLPSLDRRLGMLDIASERVAACISSCSAAITPSSSSSSQHRSHKLVSSTYLHETNLLQTKPITQLELPSIQASSTDASFTDPIALLGGESSRLFHFPEQSNQLNAANLDQAEQSCGVDDPALITNSSSLEWPISSDDSGCTLECIVRPYRAR
ncbi:hypothetical protein KP509_06G009000 [Ceratopteris richardii]|uniref:Uncharacterized protein n=1 Tax=Ceratopteris richardii TaxID=49495 RepID=A0A8T2UPX7_CERRI|nr:hypothetical protein KP509_06G009000 [Ceratopteris richardii]